MNELLAALGIFLLAIVSAFVPLVSIEVALIVSAATGAPDELLAAQVALAAAGQMVGKTCFFLAGRTAFVRWNRSHRRPARSGRSAIRRLVARASKRRGLASLTVFASALTGVPPFAAVAAIAGAWRLRVWTFVLLGFTGRLGRFAGVLLVPYVPAW